MTEDKLQAIKAQLAALPPAAWTPVAVWSDDGTINAVGPQRTNEDDAVRDAYFIAYAPANMAALLAHVDELQAKLAAVPVGPIRRWYENSNPQLMEYEFIADVETDAEFIEAWLETQVTP